MIVVKVRKNSIQKIILLDFNIKKTLLIFYFIPNWEVKHPNSALFSCIYTKKETLHTILTTAV